MTEELRREIAALRARTAELEERLAAQERAAQVQSERLAKTAAEADERTQELVRSEDELRRQANILRLVLDSMTDGVVVVDERGDLVLANPAASRMLDLAGLPASAQVARGAAPVRSSEGTLFLPDQETPLPLVEYPLSRALRGEPVEQVEIFVRPPRSRSAQRSGEDREPRSSRAGAIEARFQEDGSGLFLTVTANPMRRRDGSISGAVAVYRDATERKRLIEDLETKNRELSESEQAKGELVERLRLAIDEVSTPILELWDNVLALPVIGVVDSRRSAQIMERLLDEIVQRQSRYVIIDVTGVEMIDTRTADHFLKLMKAVWLLGAECRITGVRPAVAQTLVDLGIDLAGVRASRNLKHALRDLLQIAGKATARAHPRLGPGRRRSARKETAT